MENFHASFELVNFHCFELIVLAKQLFHWGKLCELNLVCGMSSDCSRRRTVLNLFVSWVFCLKNTVWNAWVCCFVWTMIVLLNQKDECFVHCILFDCLKEGIVLLFCHSLKKWFGHSFQFEFEKGVLLFFIWTFPLLFEMLLWKAVWPLKLIVCCVFKKVPHWMIRDCFHC